ncbi:C-type lectin domain-containing protein [Otoolea muris]|uniref:C-type lectin domain-containing protein n=1 Tax=Otoolea muris TaxID=2941515 RepID=UPI0020407FC7|nr:zinc-ribbon domain-containing protein [Otoolea muris]
MKCRKCGETLKEGAKFCTKCGTKVENTPPESIPESQVPPGQPDNGAPQPPEKNHKALAAVLLGIAVIAAGGAAAWKFQKKEPQKQAEEWGMDFDDEEETGQETPEEPGAAEPTEGQRAESAAETAPAESGDGGEAAALSQETTAAAQEEEKPHRYEVVKTDCTWEEAFLDAQARGGYLVHFDTPEEYEQIKELLSQEGAEKLKLWIGGKRLPGEYEYHWVNSDGSFDASVLNSGPYEWAWMKDEPSFRDAGINLDECYMNIFYYKSENRWVWNDVPNDIIAAVSSYKGQVGYICEYE